MIYSSVLWTSDCTTGTYIVLQWCIFCRKSNTTLYVHIQLTQTEDIYTNVLPVIYLLAKIRERVWKSNLIFHFECCRGYLYVSDCVMAIILIEIMLFSHWHNNAEMNAFLFKQALFIHNNLQFDVLCSLFG